MINHEENTSDITKSIFDDNSEHTIDNTNVTSKTEAHSINDIINKDILSYYVNFYKKECTFDDDVVEAETVEFVIMTIITRKLKQMIASEYKKATEPEEMGNKEDNTSESMDDDNVFLIDCAHMSDESCDKCSSYPYVLTNNVN